MGAQAVYVGRASRIRLPGGRIVFRNQTVGVDDALGRQLADDPDWTVTRVPSKPARRTQPRATGRPRQRAKPTAGTEAAVTATQGTSGAAPAAPDAAEGDQHHG